MPTQGDIFEATVNFLYDNDQKAVNVYDLVIGAGTCTDGELLTGCASFMTAAYANLLSRMRSTIDLQDCVVNELIWSVNEWIVTRNVGICFPTFTATDTLDMLPHSCAALVEFPTNVPRVVGKKYIPGFTEGTQDESDIAPAVITQLSDYALDIISGFAAGTASVLYTILRKTGTFVVPDTAYISPIFSTQRRRKPGVGV